MYAMPSKHDAFRSARGPLRRILPVLAVLAVALAAGCANSPRTPGPDARAVAAADEFAAWLAGNWDNFAQQEFAPAAGGGPAPVATRLHVARVTLPAFGERVLYAEWRDRDDAKLLRQRLYSVEPGATPDTLRVRLHIFAQDDAALAARTAGAWRDPARLLGLSPADMAAARLPGLEGCDLWFARQADGFAGAMRRGECIVSPPGVEPVLYSWTQMRLGRDEFAYLDGWFHADGRPFQQFTTDWYRFRRTP